MCAAPALTATFDSPALIAGAYYAVWVEVKNAAGKTTLSDPLVVRVWPNQPDKPTITAEIVGDFDYAESTYGYTVKFSWTVPVTPLGWRDTDGTMKTTWDASGGNKITQYTRTAGEQDETVDAAKTVALTDASSARATTCDAAGACSITYSQIAPGIIYEFKTKSFNGWELSQEASTTLTLWPVKPSGLSVSPTVYNVLDANKGPMVTTSDAGSINFGAPTRSGGRDIAKYTLEVALRSDYEQVEFAKKQFCASGCAGTLQSLACIFTAPARRWMLLAEPANCPIGEATGLEPHTLYNATITYINAAGNESDVHSLDFRTKYIGPYQPRLPSNGDTVDIQVVQSEPLDTTADAAESSKEFKIKWRRPSYSGGPNVAITEYTVWYQEVEEPASDVWTKVAGGAGTITVAAGTDAADATYESGLFNVDKRGVSYVFKVVVKNEYDLTNETVSDSVYVKYEEPDAPVVVIDMDNAELNETNAQRCWDVPVSWSVEYSGDAAPNAASLTYDVVCYETAVGASAAILTLTDVTDTSATIQCAKPKTEYTCKVTAKNADDSKDATDTETTPVITPGVPSPINLELTGTATLPTGKLTWGRPSDTGGEAVEYTIVVYPDAYTQPNSWMSASYTLNPNTNPWTLSAPVVVYAGLGTAALNPASIHTSATFDMPVIEFEVRPGTTVYANVTAYNSAGNRGPRSSQVIDVPCIAPTVPRDVTAWRYNTSSCPSTTCIWLNFTEPAYTGGEKCNVTEYEVTATPSGDASAAAAGAGRKLLETVGGTTVKYNNPRFPYRGKSQLEKLTGLFPAQKYLITDTAFNNVDESSVAATAVIAASPVSTDTGSEDPESPPPPPPGTPPGPIAPDALAPLPVPITAATVSDADVTIDWSFQKTDPLWLGGAYPELYTKTVTLHLFKEDCTSSACGTPVQTFPATVCSMSAPPATANDYPGVCDTAAEKTHTLTSLTPGTYTAYLTLTNSADLTSSVPDSIKEKFTVIPTLIAPTPAPSPAPGATSNTDLTWDKTVNEDWTDFVAGYTIEFLRVVFDSATGACLWDPETPYPAGATAAVDGDVATAGYDAASNTIATVAGGCYKIRVIVEGADGAADATGAWIHYRVPGGAICPPAIKKVKHLPIARTNFLGTVPECDGGSPIVMYQFVIKNIIPGTEQTKICRKRAPGQLKFGLPEDTATSDSGFHNECWDYFTPGYTYAVSAFIKNSEGMYAQSKWVPFRTPATAPGRSPLPFGSKPLNATYNPATNSMTAYMTADLNNWLSGGYLDTTIDQSTVTLSIWEQQYFGMNGKRASVCTRSSVISQPQSTWTCDSLKANTEYAAAIYGCNNEGQCTTYDKFTKITLSPIDYWPSNPVTATPASSVRFAHVTATSVRVSFAAVAGDAVTGYAVSVSSDASSACPAAAVDPVAASSSPSATLTGLAMDCVYTVSVVTKAGSAQSAATTARFFTAGPVAISGASVGSSSITFSWTVKPTVTGSTEKTGGVIYAPYYQQIGVANKAYVRMPYVTNPASSKQTTIKYTISNLLPATAYQVAVIPIYSYSIDSKGNVQTPAYLQGIVPEIVDVVTLSKSGQVVSGTVSLSTFISSNLAYTTADDGSAALSFSLGATVSCASLNEVKVTLLADQLAAIFGVSTSQVKYTDIGCSVKVAQRRSLRALRSAGRFLLEDVAACIESDAALPGLVPDEASGALEVAADAGLPLCTADEAHADIDGAAAAVQNEVEIGVVLVEAGSGATGRRLLDALDATAGSIRSLRVRGLAILSAGALDLGAFGTARVKKVVAGAPSGAAVAASPSTAAGAASAPASSGVSVGVIAAAVAGAVALVAIAVVAVVYRKLRNARDEVIMKAAYAAEPVVYPTPPASHRGSFDLKAAGLPSLQLHVSGEDAGQGPDSPGMPATSVSRRPSSTIDIGDIGAAIELPRHAVAHAAGIRSRSWREEGRRASVTAATSPSADAVSPTASEGGHGPRPRSASFLGLAPTAFVDATADSVVSLAPPGSFEPAAAAAEADEGEAAGKGRVPRSRSIKLSVPPRAEDLPPTARPDQLDSYRMP
eukprot:tig00021350_g20618.t1